MIQWNSTAGCTPPKNWKQRLKPVCTARLVAATSTQLKGKSSQMSIERQVDKADGARGYNEIFCSLQKERNCDPCGSLDNERITLETQQEGIVPGEISQAQNRYCKIPPTWGTQSIKLLETGGDWWLRGAEERGEMEGFNADNFSFARWKASVRIVIVPQRECTWYHWTAHLGMPSVCYVCFTTIKTTGREWKVRSDRPFHELRGPTLLLPVDPKGW